MSGKVCRKKVCSKEKERKRRYRESHKEQIKEYGRKYNQSHREQRHEYDRKFRAEHPGFTAVRSKRYYNPEAKRIRNIKWREANKEKTLAEHYANNHKLRGKECEFCGSTENLTAHHPDYSFPDIIVTCCSVCHWYVDNVPLKGELA